METVGLDNFPTGRILFRSNAVISENHERKENNTVHVLREKIKNTFTALNLNMESTLRIRVTVELFQID